MSQPHVHEGLQVEVASEGLQIVPGPPPSAADGRLHDEQADNIAPHNAAIELSSRLTSPRLHGALLATEKENKMIWGLSVARLLWALILVLAPTVVALAVVAGVWHNTAKKQGQRYLSDSPKQIPFLPGIQDID
jgi:hypothetical protein